MRILNFQRMSTEDGPGLRTTLFVKGCPLQCAWCHNSESIDPQPHIEWNGVHCIGCRSCVGVCLAGAVLPGPDGIVKLSKKSRSPKTAANFPSYFTKILVNTQSIACAFCFI